MEVLSIIDVYESSLVSLLHQIYKDFKGVFLLLIHIMIIIAITIVIIIVFGILFYYVSFTWLISNFICSNFFSFSFYDNWMALKTFEVEAGF